MAKIGVLGPHGRVGSFLAANGAVPLDVDITDKQKVKQAKLDDFDVIINCAAKTNVDKCQQHPGGGNLTPEYIQAVAVNVRGVENIRSNFSGRLIHISTDYVFKGSKGPYIENDKCSPVNDYGYTKWGGEIVLTTYPFDFESVIVRTTGLYGNRESVIVRTTGLYGNGNDFASAVLEKASKYEEFKTSSELRGNQTYIPHFCEALFYIAHMKYMPDVVTFVHVGSEEVVSRYEFAVQLAEAFHLSTERISACKNAEISNWIAPRPVRGGLVVEKAKKMGIPIYSIQDGLKAYAEKRPR